MAPKIPWIKFPKDEASQDAIPLWLNIAIIPYKKVANFGDRVGTNTSHSYKKHTLISVPAPMKLTNENVVNYTNNAQEILQLARGGDKTTTFKVVREKGMSQVLNDEGELAEVAGEADDKPLPTSGYLRMDMMDTMFLGGGPKTYTYEIMLVCLNSGDAGAAKAICDALSTYGWPSMSSVTPVSGTPIILPPDVFQVWLSEKIGVSINQERWTDGNGQHLSVMPSCIITKGGGESGRIAGFAGDDQDFTFSPIQYTIQVQFKEMEPTIQSPFSDLGTVNRSTAILTPSSGSAGPS